MEARRQDLDLLRSIAVSIVVLYHAGFANFEYGYIGVDIFFVLSGFLISKSASRIVDKESLILFLKRRFLRIIPSAVLVLFIVMLFSQFLFSPVGIKNVSSSMLASFFQQANLIYYLKADYFSFNNIYDPLIHFWSLGIEWVFYILMAMVYFISRKPFLVLAVFFFVSIVIYIIGVEIFPTFTFYMFPGRLWEFLVSVLLVDRFEKFISSVKIFSNHFVYYLCFLILALIVFLPAEYIIDGVRTILLVMICFIIVSMNRPPQQQLVIHKAGSFIAKISFSWYLIHQPLFAFLNYRFDLMNIYAVKLVAVAASLLLAICLYTFWEKHFFKAEIKTGLARKGLFLFALIAVPTVSTANYLSFDFRSKFKDDDLTYAENLSITQIPVGKCHFFQPTEYSDYELIQNCANEENSPIYIVFGDSHAVDIFRSLRHSLADKTIVNFSSGGCRLGSSEDCSFEELEQFIKKMKAWELVLIYNQSGLYLFDSYEGMVNRQSLYRGNLDIFINKNEVENLLVKLSQFSLENLYLLGPWVDPFINPRRLLGEFEQCDNYSIEAPYSDYYMHLDSYMEAQSKNYPKIVYLNANEVFGDPKGSYLMSCSQSVHWRDMDHLSLS